MQPITYEVPAAISTSLHAMHYASYAITTWWSGVIITPMHVCKMSFVGFISTEQMLGCILKPPIRTGKV